MANRFTRKRGTVALTRAQAYVVGARRAEGPGPRWTISEFVVLDGDVDDALLRSACEQVLAAAEPLLVTVDERGRTQRVDRGAAPVVAQHDLRGRPDPEAAARALAEDRLASPPRDPRVRLTLLRTSGSRVRLLLECDLVVADGYTAARVRTAIARAYTALVQGESVPAAPIRPLQALRDAEAGYLASRDLGEDAAFWAAAAPPAPTTLADGAPSARTDGQVRAPLHTVPAGRVRALAAAAREVRVRASTVAVVAAALVTARETHAQRVRVDLPVPGRIDEAGLDTDGAAGTTIPVVVDLPRDATARECLRATDAAIRTAFLHQRARPLDGEPGGAGLVVTYLEPVAEDFAGVPGGTEVVNAGPVRHVSLVALAADGVLHLDVRGRAGVFEADRLDALAAEWSAAIAALAADPGTSVAALLSGAVPDACDADASGREAAEIPSLGEVSEAPASYAQSALFRDVLLGGPSPAHNLPLVLDFDEAIDVRAMARALQDVVERHAVLHTVLRPHGDEVVQDLTVPIDPEHLLQRRTVTAAERDEVTRECAGYAFGLETEPPFRGWLLVERRALSRPQRLVLVLHRSAADAGSVAPLLRDLVAAYSARRTGVEPELPPLPVRYADFAAWQRARLRGPGGPIAAQREQWRRVLDGAPAETVLPVDRPYPAENGAADGTVELAWPADLTELLRGVAREHGANLFMVHHAALATLLAVLGASDDVVIGTSAPGRPPGCDDMVGLFANPLPLRTTVDRTASFGDYLRDVRATVLAALAAQDVPFGELVTMRPGGPASRHPLFQVILDWTVDPGVDGLRDVLGARIAQAGAGTSRADLHVRVTETAHGPAGVLEYRTDVFDRGTVETLLARWRSLLEQIAADPRTAVGTLDVLLDPEPAQVAQWGAPPGPERRATVPALVAEWIEKSPDALAVTDDDEKLTYRELDRAANRWARYLLSKGVRRGDVVAVKAPHSARLVVVALAVLRAGAAYLPIDAAQPSERVGAIVRDAAPRLVVDASTPPDLRAFGDAALTDEERGGPLRPDDAAYVVHPSGGAGDDHGVVVQHTGAVGLIAAVVERTAVGPGAHVFSSFPVGSDASFWDLLTALATGATLSTSGRVRVGDEFADFVEALGVTHALITPSALASVTPGRMRDLQALTVCGGPVPRRLVRTWAPGRRMVTAYGPPELTVAAVLGPLAEDDAEAHLGRPIGGARAYVLDAGLQRVPPGVVGELYIGGPGVARGYAGRPGPTAARFVADPFTADGARMFRTGDLVRWLPDGALEHLGRADDGAALRLARIAPDEAEAAPAAADGPSVVREEPDRAAERDRDRDRAAERDGERAAERGRARDAARDAWAAELDGLDSPTLLARARPGGAPSAPGLEEVSADLPENLTAAVTRLAGTLGVPLDAVLHATWAVALGGAVGTSDVVFGSVRPGSPPHAVVPVRVRLDPHRTVRAVVEGVQERSGRLREHRPPDPAALARAAGGSAPFDSLFVVGGLRNDDGAHPLRVDVTPGRGLRVRAAFRTDDLAWAGVDDLIERFRRVLTIAATRPDARLADVDATGEAQRLLVRRWGGAVGGVPARTLPALFARPAAARPQARAVAGDGTPLTYGELDALSNRWARRFLAAGVGPGDVVAVTAPRSSGSVAVLLGVAKAGGAFLSVDGSVPRERIDAVLADVRPVLEVDAAMLDAGPGEGGDEPVTDADRRVPLTPEHAAYVVVAEASDGETDREPDGSVAVVVPHAGLADLVRSFVDELDLGPGSRTLHNAPASGDAAVGELLCALTTGGTLVVSATARTGPELAAFVDEQRVTHALLTPSVLAAVPADGVGSLTSLIVGDGPVPQPLVERWACGRRLLGVHGAPGATVAVTTCRLRPGGTGLLLGRPVRGTAVRVLDDALRRVAPGTVGELYVAGGALAHGYAGRPGPTAARFVADPYGAPGARMYRTGASVRWLPDGALEYVGRAAPRGTAGM